MDTKELAWTKKRRERERELNCSLSRGIYFVQCHFTVVDDKAGRKESGRADVAFLGTRRSGAASTTE